MGFFIFMLAMDLMIPLIMIGFGRYFLNRSPKTINYLFGYRTPRSMKNEKTWAFAHKMIGKIWWRLGLALLITVIPLFFFVTASVDTIGTVGSIICGVQLIALVLSIIPVECALKARFDEDGNEKE